MDIDELNKLFEQPVVALRLVRQPADPTMDGDVMRFTPAAAIST